MCYPVLLPVTIAALKSLGLSRGYAIAVGIPLNLLAMVLAVLLLAGISDAVGRLRRRLKN